MSKTRELSTYHDTAMRYNDQVYLSKIFSRVLDPFTDFTLASCQGKAGVLLVPVKSIPGYKGRCSLCYFKPVKFDHSEEVQEF